MALASLLSVSSWTVEVLMYWVVGQAFSLHVGLHVYFLIAAGANLALSIIASPGGVGPFEVTTQAILFDIFGVEKAAASAYAISLHALLLGPVIVVGFAILWASQLSLGDVLGGQARAQRAHDVTAVRRQQQHAGGKTRCSWQGYAEQGQREGGQEHPEIASRLEWLNQPNPLPRVLEGERQLAKQKLAEYKRQGSSAPNEEPSGESDQERALTAERKSLRTASIVLVRLLLANRP